MSALKELLERVEKATGADVEVDMEIEYATITGVFGAYERRADGKLHPIKKKGRLFVPPLPYTASIDAAVALVEKKLPGWGWQVRSTTSSDGEVDYSNARVWKGHDPRDERPIYWANADAPALALIAALLKALIASELQSSQTSIEQSK